MVATMFVIKEKCQWLLKYLDIFQLSAFFNLTEPDRYKTLLNIITEIQSLVQADVPDQELLQQMWKRSETAITHQNIELGQFEHQGCEKSSKFQYWNMFVYSVGPFLRDLTRSFLEMCLKSSLAYHPEGYSSLLCI